MQDDDGDFDDLYASPAFSRSDDGAGRTSTAPSAVTPPSSPAAAATVNNKRSSRRPNTAPSAVLEPRRRASSAGDGGRRKGSEELFDVHWEDDAGVKSCCRCAGAFSLLKRKHHCRHCGRVMCSDCSVFRYFEVSRKKHRVCTVCNKTLARANRPGDSDAEATDDGAEAGQATPSGSAARKRGKLREGLKKTFAPKEGRKKRAVRTGEAAKQAAGGGADADAALSASQAALPSEDELRSPADDLFDLEDDTWFADPRVVDAAKTERRQRGADLADDEFARDMYDNQTRYSVAPPKPRAAVNEWQDMRGRHTLAIGSAIPKGPGGSLPIDVYGSRGDDALERQRARMEMPRPEQHHVAPAVTRASLDEPSAANVAPSDDDRHPRERHTLKDGLKGMFHLHGKKDGARKRRSTLATKAPVANSAPAERAGVSTTSAHSTVSVTPQPPATTLARPTFYDANVDELVVDSSLGYFDYANNRDGSAAPAVAARQSRAGPDTSRWGEALRPASLEPRVVTSDQESYSIVESPTEVTPGAANGAAATSDPVTASTPVSEPGHRGLAGALKRFLGISGAKSTGNPLDSSADPGDARQGSGALVPPVEKERQVSAPASSQPAHTGVRRESASMLRGGSFDRYSMAERSMAEKSEAASRRDDTRFTMSGYAPSVGSTYQPLDPPSTRASTFPDAFASRDIFQKTRRDTFDELFESPTNRVGASSLKDASTARAWSGVGATASAMVPTTGVDRFDRRRDDSFSYLDAEPTVLAPTVAVPSYGVATYAVPSSVPTDRFAASHDTDAFAASSTHTSIMDDIGHHRVPVASSSHQTNSVDDIFAEFERPNDYVFDPVSGGYVSASAPSKPRHSARKLSIFDHDSSSDDEAAARQPSTKRSDSKAVLRASNVSPGDSSRRVSKKKTQRRRDSFADLFEDSPKTTGSGLGGGKGYESLFQSGSGKESGSDSDGASKTKSAKAPRRSSATPVADDDEDAPSLKARGRKTETQRLEDDDDEEEELTSLKHRSRSGADRRKPQPAAMSSSVGLFSESDEEETKPVARRAKEPAKPTLRAPTRPTKPSRPVMDDIDALFDSSSERDVTNFFDFATQTVAPSEAAHGSDSEEKDTPTAVVSAVSAITTRSTGDVAPGASLSDSDEDFAPGVAKATKRRSQPCVDAKATVAETTIAATTESGSNAVDSDEEFSSMLKSTRSRSLQSTSVATIPLTIRGVAATASALENTNDSDKNAAGVSVGGLDEEFTLQLSQTKTKRVKSVSFVDAAHDDGSDAGDAEAFSFEVKPKQRTARAPVASVEPLRPKKHAAEDEDDGVLLLGRYSTPALVSASVSQVLPLITGDADADTDTSALTAGVAAAAAEVLSESALQQAGVASDTDGDWRQLQEQEKERRKKLQLKQRQAQREKLLQSKKQGASSKQLNPPGSSASASSEKKKKAKKDRASAAADSSAAPTSSSSTTGARKKSSSASKKHKSTAKDDSEDTIDSTRTEL
ncbi:hypothetical protein PybrP1_006409 [[Pythium] brassicae (nom. inval.)]|nr:hypothetical protein PybrP1_006409 [[Pythium] brassicae (nom. inval.)]